MDIHYNAFISYRHHPEDIRVATEIHRSLERFKVPRALRKRTGGITRLFRDKDELPITSSLTDDITRALRNSDFLIVICSTHTKESVWVEREIETFLQTHDRNKILTVLVDGEPYDTIPEILLHEDITDPDTGKTTRVEYEPLSCDWRLPRRKARQEELPRLAAALLGCGYDELRQRQRQYRMRRLITIFSLALAASLGLTAYFVKTSITIQKANDDLQEANEQIRAANVRIQENLDEALRNQSQYLTSSASERFDAGDRLTAITLAMAALPGEKGERPYLPEAELTLSSVMSLYEPSEELASVGVFDAGAVVSDFEISSGGDTAWLADARYRLTVWDTNTFTKRATVDLGAVYVEELEYTPGGNVLVLYESRDDRLACVSPQGEVLWDLGNCWDFAFLDQRAEVMLLQKENDRYQILFLDPETGEQTREKLLLDWEQTQLPLAFAQTLCSGELPITMQCLEEDACTVAALDLSDGKLEIVTSIRNDYEDSLLKGWVICVSVTEAGNILVMVSDGSGTYNGRVGSEVTTGPSRSEIFCFSGSSHAQLWKAEITCYTVSSGASMESIPGTGNILAKYGNVLQIFDGKTGKTVSRCEAQDVILDVTVAAEEARFAMENGSYGVYYYEDNQCKAIPFMESSLEKVRVNGGYFSLSRSDTQVTVYRLTCDESWTVLEDLDCGYGVEKAAWGDRLAVLAYRRLYLADMKTRQLCWSYETDSGVSILAFSEDGSRLFLLDEYKEQVMCFDVETGGLTRMDIPMDMLDWASLHPYTRCVGDRLYYMVYAQDETGLGVMDLNSWELEAYFSLEDEQVWAGCRNAGVIEASEGYAWTWTDGGYVCEISLETGRWRVLREDVTQVPNCRYEKAADCFVLFGNDELIRFTPGQEEEKPLATGQNDPFEVYFYGEELLVLCDDGSLYRYDEAGNQLGVVPLNIYSGLSAKISSRDDPMGVFWEQTEDGDLILGLFGAGNIIDCEAWGVKAFVPYLQAYHRETDSFFCTYNGSLGAFKRVSLTELLEKARTELNGFELSQEQKNNYGLD